MRHLISLSELATEDVASLTQRAVKLADMTDRGCTPRTLTDRRIGIYFSKTSTRTRSAFWSAASRLGADSVSFGPDDLQTNTGETLKDTAAALAQYLDALVVRTNGAIDDLWELSSANMSVVNALTRNEHPTQALADLTTLTEHFGDLTGRHLLCVGEGNSSARALALAASLTPGLRLTLLCPDGYAVPQEHLDTVGGRSRVTQISDPEKVTDTVDAVYTSRWQTMGVAKENPDWMAAFSGFRIDADFMARVGDQHTVFLHDLPAVRGQEVADEVLDGDRSLAWRQSFHKMTAAMSVLEWCLLDDFPGAPS